LRGARKVERSGEVRVVVTGLGAVTPLGDNADSFWRGLLEGRSGVRRIERFDASEFTTRIGAEVRDFDAHRYFSPKEARRTDRFTQFAIASADMALENAGLRTDEVDPCRLAVVLGTGIGGIETLTDQFAVLREKGPRRVSPFFIPMMIANIAAGQIAIRHGAKGPNVTVVTACASGSNAIGDAFRLIQRGDVDAALAGGAEAPFVPVAFAGFCAMRALSTRNDEPERASRPFDAGRDGFVMGEGAGVVVLESLERAVQRGARIYAEVVGFGTTADAHHVAEPAPGGDGGARSMEACLEDAGLEPGEVDYINAHGTSTPKNDLYETMAVKKVFGERTRVAISSTKSMTGHLLGAAGAIEFIATVLSVHHGIVPPTINYEQPDPECDLDYVPNEARRMAVRVALSNSFGFGGQNATLAVRRWEDGAE